MTVELQATDFRRLVEILQNRPEFANERDRRRLVAAALAGASRADAILAGLDLGGPARGAAVEVITHLANFGQVEDGKEALGVLLDYLKDLSGTETSSYIATLFETYPLDNGIIVPPPSNNEEKPGPKLRVFLCHASEDKAPVRALYARLREDGFKPWLDEEDLLPGQDWRQEIRKTVRASDIVLVCLSKRSISKTGFVHKEIKYALDVADEQPEGAIFLIPAKLEECALPERLSHLHGVNLFHRDGYQKLLSALFTRAPS